MRNYQIISIFFHIFVFNSIIKVMKRFGAIIVIAFIVISVFTPLWGVGKVRAQGLGSGTLPYSTTASPSTDTRIPSKGTVPDISDVFLDENGMTGNLNSYTLKSSQNSLSIDPTETTAFINIKLSFYDKYNGAEDDDKNGILSPGDYFGGWSVVLNKDYLYNFNNDDDSGIYLELKEGDTSTPITEGGPLYSTTKLIQRYNDYLDKIGAPSFLKVTKIDREKFSVSKGSFNILPFFAFLNDSSLFGPKQQTWGTGIRLTELKPDTTYYARLSLRAVGDFDIATSEYVSFKTSPAGSKDDPSLQELEEGVGESVGATGGATKGTVFGQEIGCSFGFLSGQKMDIQGCFVMLYYNSVYWVSGLLLRVAAGIMDAFMAISLSSTIYQNTFIETGWTIVRDVCNIFFIFILLWTAFKMVINDTHYHANKVIVNIIVIGLLINFSLFFSRVIIDMGNISARVFYNQIRVTDSTDQKAQQDAVAAKLKTIDSGGLEPKSISEALANGLNLAKIENEGYKKMSNGGADINYGVIWLLLILATLVNLVAMWIFVKVSFAFLGRVLTLWIGMIMSPFAFTSTIVEHGALEHIKKLSWKDWLDNMLEASFYPAVFLFFIYLIIVLIKSNFIQGIMSAADDPNLSGSVFLIMVLFQFAFIIGLLKVAADFAKKMSGTFGGGVTDMVGKAAGFLGGAAVGVATGGIGVLAQKYGGAAKAINTLNGDEGDLLKKASTGDKKAMMELRNPKYGDKYKHFKNINDASSKEDVELARKKAQREVESLQKRSTTSWDLRNTKGMQVLSNATGLNFNAGVGSLGLGTDKTTGGLQAQIDRRAVKDAAYFKSINASEDEIKRAKEGVDDSKKALEDAEKNSKEKIAELEEKNKNFVQRAQAGGQLTDAEKIQLKTNQDQITWIKGNIDEAHKQAKEKDPATGKFVDIPTPGPGATQDEKEIHKIALAKRTQLQADDTLKESSKSGLRRYQEYLQKSHYNHGGRDVRPQWGAFGVRRLVRGDVRGAMTDFRKDLSTAITGAMSGAVAGTFIGGPLGTLIGGIGGGVLYTMKKHMLNLDQKLVNLTDHAVAANHIHEPHTKSKYKKPGGAWLGKVLDGKGFGGIGGGHDDHGHDGGHDDHGHGGGGH
jgi:hypothetical protein